MPVLQCWRCRAATENPRWAYCADSKACSLLVSAGGLWTLYKKKIYLIVLSQTAWKNNLFSDQVNIQSQLTPTVFLWIWGEAEIWWSEKGINLKVVWCISNVNINVKIKKKLHTERAYALFWGAERNAIFICRKKINADEKTLSRVRTM